MNKFLWAYVIIMAILLLIINFGVLEGYASIPPDSDEKIMDFRCEKRENWTTLIHVNGSKDAIELKGIYCPYIKVD